LNLHSILKSLSLYLDFHLWKQEDIRRKLSFLSDLAHRKSVLFLVIIQQMGHKCCGSLSCLNLKLKSVDVNCVIGLEYYQHF
jgi:hypothetical protein